MTKSAREDWIQRASRSMLLTLAVVKEYALCRRRSLSAQGLNSIKYKMTQYNFVCYHERKKGGSLKSGLVYLP